MLKNYLKIALRSFWRNRLYAFINILGLSFGLSICLLLSLYVRHELSFDRHLPSELYRVSYMAPNNQPWLLDRPEVALGIKSQIPGIQRFVRVKPFAGLMQFGQTKFNENKILFVDESFLDVFQVKLEKGKANKALKEANSVIISRKMAEKYFGFGPAIGQTLYLFERNGSQKLTLQISGVMQELPENSHLKADFLIRYSNNLATQGNVGVYTYLMLQPNTLPKNIEDRFTRISAEHKQNYQIDSSVKINLQRVKEIHLHSHFLDEIERGGNLQSIYIFSISALLVLLIACVNYINLSIALNSTRGKEVGMRKIFGGIKSDIFIQCLVESVPIILITVLVAIMILEFSLPYFNYLLSTNFEINYLTQIPIALAILIIIVLLSSIYPALVLTFHPPVFALKKISPIQLFKNNAFTKSLLALQFTIVIVLLIFTSVIYQQLNYALHKKLGFSQEQVLILDINNPKSQKRIQLLKNELLKNAEIMQIGVSHTVPTSGNYDGLPCKMPVESSVNGFGLDGFGATTLFMDESYFDLMQFSLIEGKRFQNANSAKSLIINESAVKMYGWQNPQNALGKKIGIWNSATHQMENFSVIGVVKDFHIESLHSAIEPIHFQRFSPSDSLTYGYISTPAKLSIKLKSEKIAATLQFISQIWGKFDKEFPLEYTFLEERVQQSYLADRRLGESFVIFTGVIIFITCMGLFSISTFMVRQKTKEIGIRKVLGASVQQIIMLLSDSFIKIMFVAIIIAFPLAWWLVSQWMANFAYQTPISIWIFVLSTAFSFFIVGATIGLQTFKITRLNPVEVLRDE
jgi:putative ABC transport system permease protein